MEELREKMCKYIELYGPLDPRTVAVSQELDIMIVESMKGGYMYGNTERKSFNN